MLNVTETLIYVESSIIMRIKYILKRLLFSKKEKLFSSPVNYKSILGYSYSSCVDLIKCIEFYDNCSDDIEHWVHDVATAQFKILEKYNLFGANLICYALSDKSLNLLENKNFLYKVRERFKSQNDAIDSFKDDIWNSKLNEKDSKKYKYRHLLGNKKLFNYSNKFYFSFFDLLSKVLNFELSLTDLENYFWGIDPISGRISSSKELYKYRPKLKLKDSKVSKKEFENLIYGVIFLIKNQKPPKNRELYKKFMDCIK